MLDLRNENESFIESLSNTSEEETVDDNPALIASFLTEHPKKRIILAPIENETDKYLSELFLKYRKSLLSY